MAKDEAERFATFIKEFTRYFPPGFIKVRTDNDSINLKIGDADISFDSKFHFLGSGRAMNSWSEWEITRRQGQEVR